MGGTWREQRNSQRLLGLEVLEILDLIIQCLGSCDRSHFIFVPPCEIVLFHRGRNGGWVISQNRSDQALCLHLLTP